MAHAHDEAAHKGGYPRLEKLLLLSPPVGIEEGHWLRPCGQHYPRRFNTDERKYCEHIAYGATLACRYPQRMSKNYACLEVAFIVSQEERVVYTPWFDIGEVAKHLNVPVAELVFCIDAATSFEHDMVSATRYQLTADQTAMRVRRPHQKAVRKDPYGPAQ